jgi:hypothetical protein
LGCKERGQEVKLFSFPLGAVGFNLLPFFFCTVLVLGDIALRLAQHPELLNARSTEVEHSVGEVLKHFARICPITSEKKQSVSIMKFSTIFKLHPVNRSKHSRFRKKNLRPRLRVSGHQVTRGDRATLPTARTSTAILIISTAKLMVCGDT